MISRRIYLIGAATNWFAFMATMIVAFFIAPYLIRKLGDAPYGVWVFIESILAYFTLFDLGIAACVVRYVSRFRTTGELTELNRFVSAALLLFLAVGGLAILLGIALTPFFIRSLSEKSGIELQELVFFTILMFVNLGITLPLSLFPAMLDGLERFTGKSVIRIICLTFRTAGTIALMETKPSLLQLGLLFTGMNLLEHLGMIWLAYRGLPGLKFRFSGLDRETYRLVWGYSKQAFLVMISGRITIQSGTILIGIFLTAPQITWYAISSRLIEFAKSFVRTVTLTLTPAFSALDAKSDHEGIRQLFLQLTRWTLYLILPIQIGLIVFGKPFLQLWLHSEEYIAWCYPALVILASTLSISIAHAAAARVCYGSGKMDRFVRWSLLEAGLNLVLTLALIGPFGIEGVAIATSVASGIGCILVIGSVCSDVGLDWGRYCQQGWMKPLGCTILPTILWISLDLPLRNWLELGSSLLLGVIPYALMILLVEGGIQRIRKRRLDPTTILNAEKS